MKIQNRLAGITGGPHFLKHHYEKDWVSNLNRQSTKGASYEHSHFIHGR